MGETKAGHPRKTPPPEKAKSHESPIGLTPYRKLSTERVALALARTLALEACGFARCVSPEEAPANPLWRA